MTVTNPIGSGGAALTQGTLAARPAASTAGALYYATDVGQMFVTNAAGNAWQTVGAMLFGTAAARPAAGAGNANTVYFATDTGELTVSNGSAWSEITRVGNGLALGGFNQAMSTVTGGWQINGNWDITTAGNGLLVKEGANAKQGVTAAMSAGVVTTANTSVGANSRIFYCQQSGTLTGFVTLTRSVGVSFTLTSSVNTDTAVFAYEIFEPG